MTRVVSVDAIEILDSRGSPTIEVILELSAGTVRASVPSGKSTGAHEARERRDGDPARYRGQGVLDAVRAVRSEVAPLLVGRSLPPQADLDAALIALDGTPQKARVGANTLLGVSLAGARAHALVRRVALHESLGRDLSDASPRLQRLTTLPVPCFNVLNGGAHADNPLELQEFMLVPGGLPTYGDALRAGAEIYRALGADLAASGLSTTVGDEGGYAPAVATAEEALTRLTRAIRSAGYAPGTDVAIALDPAANGFFHDGAYILGGVRLTAEDLCDRYAEWVDRYAIVSIEDGLAEDDRAGWNRLTRVLGASIQIVGDDLFVSDSERVRAGISEALATAVLLKPNQIGTVTELAATAGIAKQGGLGLMMSHRSGETDDAFIADLAVALGVPQIKAGAPARGERVAKYNQLLRIEHAAGAAARYAGWAAFGRDRQGVRITGHPVESPARDQQQHG